MSSDEKVKAYAMAREAGRIDFEAALSGLMAGHKDAIEEMSKRLASKDRAFLIALSLSEKGARLDKDGFMAMKVAEEVCDESMAEVERKFLDRIARKTEKASDA